MLDNTFCAEFVAKLNRMNKVNDFMNVTLANSFNYLDNKFVKFISFTELKEVIAAKKFNSVIFHYLNTSNLKLIKIAPKEIKLCWVVYGVEIFAQRRFRSFFLTSKTLAKTRFSFDKSIFDKLFWRMKTKFNLNFALKRLDFAAMWIDGDHEILRVLTPAKNIKMLPFCYPAKLLKLESNSQKRILVGNNGFITNNHFDGVDYIVKNNLHNDYEVIFLMTTDEGTYKEKVFNYAKLHLGNNFTFIEEKLSYDDFLNLLSTTEIAIFPHLRSQGGVTTRSLLYFGKTIVSFSSSNMIKKLTSLGCTFISMNDPFRTLTQEEIRKNKEVIDGHFGSQGQTKSIFNLIENLS